MSKVDQKHAILVSINQFETGNLRDNSIQLFNCLGYDTSRQANISDGTYNSFREMFVEQSDRFSEEKILKNDWITCNLLFQLTKSEIINLLSLFDTNKVDNTIIESYLFFALELREEEYSRTTLSIITREINKLFPMPVMLLFKYGGKITISIINRRIHKRDDNRDVLEKVTLIKDIKISGPHRAHIEILFDLSINELQRNHGLTSFVDLHNAWQKTLDTKELNKRFFKELSNWYFFAVERTIWPDDLDIKKDIRNANNVIRLITRLIFVWFLKEKELVSNDLFQIATLKKLLKSNGENKSIYYKAILQNLFFATLNTEMGTRKFRSKSNNGRDPHCYIPNVLRYENAFSNPEDFLEKYFDSVPFLNGGLFECLYKEVEADGKLKKIHIDGFSDRDDNILKVPDELFFCEQEQSIDLNQIYGTKNKTYHVRGIIDILNSYKFTIAENTPLEEEVALDPELLGKVFENLLANFNPETQTTARKQTGSFYTPREIVHYMVDESLIPYLLNSLNNTEAGSDEKNESRLRQLLDYTDSSHGFNIAEVALLIKAIDECKILDPACGSGAYPMGVLHKLVYILHKLDPENLTWKKLQIKKALSIDDPEIRETTIQTIEDAFVNNELDYGRKLFLIENCIYGIDIQPIAIQIAKLRFFISLIVDQKVNHEKSNLGIRPLPNLETKFVSANTLIPLEEENLNLFTNEEIGDIKYELKEIRLSHFSAKSPATKKKLRLQDSELREKLRELLVTNYDLQPETAKKLASWDPYDQNISAPFFDSDWMFGITAGFNIVLGNPPYVVNNDKVLKSIYRESVYGRSNLYGYFIHCSLWKLLKEGGILFFINPKTLLTDSYFSGLRKFILKNYSIYEIVNIVDRRKTFESVLQSCILNAFVKSSQTPIVKVKEISTKEELNNNSYISVKKDEFTFGIDEKIFMVGGSEIHYDIFREISTLKSLKKWGIEFTTGKIQWDLWSDYLSSEPNENATRLIWAENIQRYQVVKNRNRRFIYINKPIMPIAPINFPTIIVQRTTAVEQEYRIIATYVNPIEFSYSLQTENHTSFLSDNRSKFSIQSVLGLLNSKFIDFVFRYINSNTQVSSGELGMLPVPSELLKYNNVVSNLVSWMLFSKSIDHIGSALINRIIDGIFYQLFLPDILNTHNCDILKHTSGFLVFDDNWTENKKKKNLELFFLDVYNPEHPISTMLLKLLTIKEVSIIEERK